MITINNASDGRLFERQILLVIRFISYLKAEETSQTTQGKISFESALPPDVRRGCAPLLRPLKMLRAAEPRLTSGGKADG
jgi:hypothetical protein